MELWEKIKKGREKIGKSQETVAREIGVTLRTYQQYECGKVKPKYRRLLENALNVPIGTLDEQELDSNQQINFLFNSIYYLIKDRVLKPNDIIAFINEICFMINDSNNPD